MIVLTVALVAAYAAEAQGNPRFTPLNVDQTAQRQPARRQHGGQRGAVRHRTFGDVGRRHHRSVNGSVNSMHDSFTRRWADSCR